MNSYEIIIVNIIFLFCDDKLFEIWLFGLSVIISEEVYICGLIYTGLLCVDDKVIVFGLGA